MVHPTAICLFLNLFVCLVTTGQVRQLSDTLETPRIFKQRAIIFYQNMGYSVPAMPVKKPASTSINEIPVKTLPQNFYASHIGFFCTKELQVEKLTKIGFRFRLGSVSYTDGMEGKNNGRLH